MQKPITIKDLAKVLNLSPSTVSRALNDRWDVNQQTRQRVLDAAEKMNYRPNVMSLGLKRNQTFTVGVVIPEFVNSFFAEVINGIESVLHDSNYQLLICQSSESPAIEKRNIEFMESRHVDGFLVSVSHQSQMADYYTSLIERGYPVVFFNRYCQNVKAPRVIVDDKKWAFAATEHLIRQGCKRIAHLEGPDNLSVSELRREGYIDALISYNIPVDESLIIPSGIFLEDGVAAAQKILAMQRKPDGIFAVNDPAAIGVIKELKRNGVSVPKEIAVVGFSESMMATIVEPNLTSVSQPTFEIGASSARLILEWMQIGRMPRNLEVKLDASLNVRESSLRKLVRKR